MRRRYTHKSAPPQITTMRMLLSGMYVLSMVRVIIGYVIAMAATASDASISKKNSSLCGL